MRNYIELDDTLERIIRDEGYTLDSYVINKKVVIINNLIHIASHILNVEIDRINYKPENHNIYIYQKNHKYLKPDKFYSVIFWLIDKYGIDVSRDQADTIKRVYKLEKSGIQ